MPLKWTTGAMMRPAPCLPCCAGEEPPPPAECACALLLPPLNGTTPYADYTTAAAVLADTEAVHECFAYVDNAGLSGILTSTVTDSGTAIDFDQTFSGTPGATGWLWLSLNGFSGDTWSFAYTGNGTPGDGDPSYAEAILIYVYDCAGTLLDTIDTSGTGTTPVTYVLPADGTYIIKLQVYCTLFVGTCFDTASATFTSSGSYTTNPVIALWDDSGTTRQLEACPKMLLPPLTESTGDWYADCAEADAVLTDPLQVSNCVGYFDTSATSPLASTATDGGTSLTLAQTYLLAPGDSSPMWGSINAETGETLSFAFSGNGVPGIGDPPYAEAVIAQIYDYTGTLIYSGFTDGTTSGPLVSSALPYTGRYTVRVVVSCTLFLGACFNICSSTITSSGTMTVNPIAAAYDVGITCPALLSCGDSCP